MTPTIFVLIILFGTKADTSLRFLTEAQCEEASRKLEGAGGKGICVAKDLGVNRAAAPSLTAPVGPTRRN